MPVILVNPMSETPHTVALPPPRLATLGGKTIGLLDISKPGGSIFLDRLEALLRERYGVARVERVTKPTYTKPAPADMIEKLRGFDAVVEALAD